MEHNSKRPRIRHAEKDRKFSSCKFADRVFHCVMEQLENIVEKYNWPTESLPNRKNIENENQSKNERQQSVLAAFLIHDNENDLLKCVSLGMGTKFLDNDVCTNGQRGMRNVLLPNN